MSENRGTGRTYDESDRGECTSFILTTMDTNLPHGAENTRKNPPTGRNAEW